ncbi:MAG: peptidase [Chitinophagaceae bacterium]|nr:peptidase [Chitinophagaceae bacterium]
MVKQLRRFLLGCIFFPLCLFMNCSSGYSQSLSGAELKNWKEDLRYLKDNMQRVHFNPYHKTGKEAFQYYTDSVIKRLDKMNSDEALVALTKMVALIGDGHTLINFFSPGQKFHCFPLRTYVFEDGIYVIDAAEQYKDLVGKKLIKVGNRGIENYCREISGLPQRDNEYQVKQLLPFYLSIAEIMHGMGAIARADRADYVFENSDGTTTTRTIQSTDLRSFYLDQFNHSSTANGPLYRRDIRKLYWYEYLAKQKTLYIAYNVVNDDPNDSLNLFCKRIEALVEEKQVDKVIVDLRNNGGGDNGTCQPLVDLLSKNLKINRRGHLFTLIGRVTFSAASYFTSKLELNTQTLFIGEPTGASPNHFGDNRPLILPGSGIEVRLSSVLWGNTFLGDKRLYTQPDIKVGLKSFEFFNLKDPVLNKVFEINPADFSYTNQAKGPGSELIGEYLFSPLNTATFFVEEGKLKFTVADVDHLGRDVSFISGELFKSGKNHFETSVRGLSLDYQSAHRSMVVIFYGVKHTMQRKPFDYTGPGKYFNQGKVDQAMNIILATYKTRPYYKGFHERYLYGWSYSYIQRKNYDAAIALFRFMSELYPYSIQALTGLAEAQTQKGNLPEALSTYQKIILLDPDNVQAKKVLNRK